MTIEDLKKTKWYTIGGGDSYLKCVEISENWVLFITMSEVHGCIRTSFMDKSEIEDWGDNMYELPHGEWYDDDLQRSVMKKESYGWDDGGASFRDEAIEKYQTI